MLHTSVISLCIERAVFYFTATADPFRVGVRAATTAAPLYVHASIRVGSATADQIVPLHKICAVRADVHSRPPARVQWYIGPVAQRSCVAAFKLVRFLAVTLARALTLALLWSGTAATAAHYNSSLRPHFLEGRHGRLEHADECLRLRQCIGFGSATNAREFSLRSVSGV